MNLQEISKPILYVLIGVPASGKSTWVRKFLSSTEEKFEVISSDDIIEELSRQQGKTYTDGFIDNIGKATQMVKQKAKKAFSEKKNVIWDQTNMSVKKRKGILAQADGYYKIAVDFSPPDDKELNRRLDYRSKHEGKFVPRFVIDNMLKSYQPPSKEEGFDKIIEVK